MIATPDLLWKFIIEGRFADFLRFFFRQHEHMIDFERPFEFLDKELQQLFPESASSKRYVDKLVKVWLLDGREKWVLVHVEVQGFHDTDFAARMFQYYYRILDRYRVEVTSIAILTDESRSWKPDRHETSLMGTSVVFRYNVFKLAVQSKDKLLRSGNFFGFLMAIAHDALRPASDVGKLKSKLGTAKKLLQLGLSAADLNELFSFLRYYWRFEDPGFYRTFEDEIDFLTNKVQPMNLQEALIQVNREDARQIGREEGVQIGREEGVQIGEDKTTRMHIRNMFLRGQFTRHLIADILPAEPDMVDDVAKNMLAAGEISVQSLVTCGYSESELANWRGK